MHKELRPQQIDILVGSPAVNDEFSKKIKELDRRLQANGMQYRQWDTLNDRQHDIFADNLFLDGECASSMKNYVMGAINSCWCPDVVEDLHHHSPVLMREIEKQQEMLPDMTVKIGENLNNLNETIDLLLENIILSEQTFKPNSSVCNTLVGNTGIRFEWSVLATLIDRGAKPYGSLAADSESQNKLACARSEFYKNKKYGKVPADQAAEKLLTLLRQIGAVDEAASDFSGLEVGEAVDVEGTEIKTDLELRSPNETFNISLKMGDVVQGESRRGIGGLETFQDSLGAYEGEKTRQLEQWFSSRVEAPLFDYAAKELSKEIATKLQDTIGFVKKYAYDDEKRRVFVGDKKGSDIYAALDAAEKSAGDRVIKARISRATSEEQPPASKVPTFAWEASEGYTGTTEEADPEEGGIPFTDREKGAIEDQAFKKISPYLDQEMLKSGFVEIADKYRWDQFFSEKLPSLSLQVKDVAKIDPDFAGVFVDNILTGRDTFLKKMKEAEAAGDKEMAQKWKRGIADILLSPAHAYDLRQGSPNREASLEALAGGVSPRGRKKGSGYGLGDISVTIDLKPKLMKDVVARATNAIAAPALRKIEAEAEDDEVQMDPGPSLPGFESSPANRDEDSSFEEVEKEINKISNDDTIIKKIASLLRKSASVVQVDTESEDS
jgi:hypothetical protein